MAFLTLLAALAVMLLDPSSRAVSWACAIALLALLAAAMRSGR